MKRYVVGFAILNAEVLLVEKDRPEIWKGLVTGPGGKIDPGETGPQAMVREWHEETGNGTHKNDWSHVATVRTGEYEVEFYRINQSPWQFRQIESERLFVRGLDHLPRAMFANARWALALACDPNVAGPVLVDYGTKRDQVGLQEARRAAYIDTVCGAD